MALGAPFRWVPTEEMLILQASNSSLEETVVTRLPATPTKQPPSPATKAPIALLVAQRQIVFSAVLATTQSLAVEDPTLSWAVPVTIASMASPRVRPHWPEAMTATQS